MTINNFFKDSVKKFIPYIPNENYGMIRLDANESPFNLSVEVREKVMSRIKKFNFMQYPDTNSDKLREKISDYIGFPKDNIVVGNGSDEMIHVLLNTFIEKDDKVISHNPTFSMYGINTEVLGGYYQEIDSDSEFHVDIDALIKKANETKAKVVFLCNPNNPTGKTTSKKDIINLIEKTNSIIVVDEAYIEFGGESIVNEISNYERLIVLRTLSKAFGAAALRVGYLISSKEIADKISAVKPPYNLNGVSQMIAEEILSDLNTIEDNIKIIKSEKNRVYKELQKIEKIKLYESSTNFILFKVENAEEVFEKLKSKRILIRLFKGGKLNNHLRVSMGSIMENQKFVDCLKEILTK